MPKAPKAHKMGSLVREARDLVGLSLESAARKLRWEPAMLQEFEKISWELSNEDLEEMLDLLFDISICDFRLVMEQWVRLSGEARLQVVYEGVIRTFYD